MALFDAALIQATLAQVHQRFQALEQALDAPHGTGELYNDLEVLIGVANGIYVRTDDMVQVVDDALTRVLDLLLGNVLERRANYPDDFWNSDIGIVVSRVRWWISGEDLITISNAAALAFGTNTQANRMRIARAMDRGTLDWVPDPSVLNPQQNRRVLRSQVERLRALSRLPE